MGRKDETASLGRHKMTYCTVWRLRDGEAVFEWSRFAIDRNGGKTKARKGTCRGARLETSYALRQKEIRIDSPKY